MREKSETELLIKQYEERFGEMIPLKMVHFTEEELKQTLRECLRTGKEYEMPDEIKELMLQGVDF